MPLGGLQRFQPALVPVLWPGLTLGLSNPSIGSTVGRADQQESVFPVLLSTIPTYQVLSCLSIFTPSCAHLIQLDHDGGMT